MQSFFPSVYSILDPIAISQFLKTNYGFHSAGCQLLSTGVHDSYLINTREGDYVFRVYRKNLRSKPEVEAEIAFLEALRHQEISIAYPIADGDFKYVAELNAIEGKRDAVLFRFAPGKTYPTLSKTQLQELGAELARLHAVAASIQLPGERWTYDTETTISRPLLLAKDYLEKVPEEFEWLQEAADDCIQYLNALPANKFRSGAVHYDILPKNFHFDDNDRVCFYDFDFFGYGWLVNDLMTFWVHLQLDVFNGRSDQATADGAFLIFLKSYNSISPLSKEEIAAIPKLSIGFWLFYMGFHTTHNNFKQFLEPAHLKLRIKIIKRLLEQNIKAK